MASYSPNTQVQNQQITCLFKFDSICSSIVLVYNHNFIYSKIWFYSKIIIFVYLFIYLSNADVENCGEVKGFGFIYIYIDNNNNTRK